MTQSSNVSPLDTAGSAPPVALSAADASRVHDLTKKATKLTFSLTALMEASAVIAVVERTDLGGQVAERMGHRMLNDELGFDLAPIICQIADSYSARIHESLDEIRKLVTAEEGASDEQ